MKTGCISLGCPAESGSNSNEQQSNYIYAGSKNSDKYQKTMCYLFFGCMKIPKRNFLHRKLLETIFLCSEIKISYNF